MTTTFPSEGEPEVVIETLPDGCVRITIGGIAGTVSSLHLTAQKIAQLRAAWWRDRA